MSTAVLAHTPDLVAAAGLSFLRVLDSEGFDFTFQTFDDVKREPRRADLATISHGKLIDHLGTFATLNSEGAGIYVMVNAGDLQGRKEKNVRRVRTLFVDLDVAPLDPVLDPELPPRHIIVQTSPDRFHCHWRVSDCPLADFSWLQKALAAKFWGDPSVCDLPRVMRIWPRARKAFPRRSAATPAPEK